MAQAGLFCDRADFLVRRERRWALSAHCVANRATVDEVDVTAS